MADMCASRHWFTQRGRVGVKLPNCVRCGALNPKWPDGACALRASDLNSVGVFRGSPCGAQRDTHPVVTTGRYGFLPHPFLKAVEVKRG